MELATLKSALLGGETPELLANGEPADIKDATQARFGGSTYDLSLGTNFEAQDPDPRSVDLKTIIHAWLTRSLGLAEYISSCDDSGIHNLKFAERADLLGWLEGAAESEYIKTAASEPATASTLDVSQSLDGIQDLLKKESVLLDHNKVLYGAKRIDFSAASKDCHKLIMQEFKQHKKFSRAQTPTSPAVQGKNKEPIILLSPSPSSLINMSNIKELLENGKFVPSTRNAATANFTRITRDSPTLGRLKFFVVDNVDRFKPEYWNRVVAVFVTGQQWQLKSYKWSDPKDLFNHVLGLSVQFKGDPLPGAISQWNVAIEQLERNQRFRDNEVVERIWERLEARLLSLGWSRKGPN